MWGRVRKDRQQEGEDGAVKRVTSLMAFRVARGGGAEKASQISQTGDQRCCLDTRPALRDRVSPSGPAPAPGAGGGEQVQHSTQRPAVKKHSLLTLA